jgi:hypothetical protein
VNGREFIKFQAQVSHALLIEEFKRHFRYGIWHKHDKRVRFEVFTAVTMNNAIFCDVMPCSSCENRRFRGTCCLHHQGNVVFLHSVLRLLVTANVVPSSQTLVTLLMEALHSSETLVLTRAAWHNIPEDGMLHDKHIYIRYEHETYGSQYSRIFRVSN